MNDLNYGMYITIIPIIISGAIGLLTTLINNAKQNKNQKILQEENNAFQRSIDIEMKNYQNQVDRSLRLTSKQELMERCWNNLLGNSIKKANSGKKDIIAIDSLSDKIREIVKYSNGENKILELYTDPIIYLSQETLICSFSFEVHFLILKFQELNYKVENTNQTNGQFDPLQMRQFVLFALIIYYLKIEWHQFVPDKLPWDYILIYAVNDYHSTELKQKLEPIYKSYIEDMRKEKYYN